MNRKCLPAIFLFLTAALPGQAALIFFLDPLAKTFSFSGSDSGTPNPLVSDGISEWTTEIPLVGSIDQNISLSGAVTAGSGLSFFNTPFFQFRGSVDRIEIEIHPRTPAFQTITGTEVPISYGALSATYQSSLEAFVAGGGTFDLALGTGFAPIATAVVPESSPAILFGLAAAAMVLTLAGRKDRRPVPVRLRARGDKARFS